MQAIHHQWVRPGTLRRVANAYDTPIMSRTAQDGAELLPQTPHSTAPNHHYQTRSSARRSNRLAAQHGAQYDVTPMRGQEQTTQRARKVTRTTTRKYDETSEMQTNGHGEAYTHDSGIYNRSGAMSVASQSGLLAEQNQINRSLQNMYGRSQIYRSLGFMTFAPVTIALGTNTVEPYSHL